MVAVVAVVADNSAPDVPETLNYGVSGQWYSTPDLLRGVLSGEPGLTFTLNSIFLEGTYNRTTFATTLQENNEYELYDESQSVWGRNINSWAPHSGGNNGQMGGIGLILRRAAFQLNISASPFNFDRIMVSVNANAGGHRHCRR